MMKVLIADDEMKVCQLIRELADWDALGLTVADIANDGLAALDMIQLHTPDILITDIRMPGLDGIELIRQAKEIQPALQCIIISGYRHFDYAHNAIRYGVEDYLLKPINQQEFVSTLQKLADKQRRQTKTQLETEALKQQAVMGQERILADFVRQLLHSVPSGSQSISFPQFTLGQAGQLSEDGYFCAIVKPDLSGISPQDQLHGLATEKTVSHIRQHLASVFPVLIVAAAAEGALVVFHQGSIPLERISGVFKELMEELYPLRALFPSMEVTTALSLPAESEELASAMKQAYQALCERLRLGTGQVLTYAPKAGGAGDLDAILSVDIRKGLLAALEILDEAGYQVQLEKALTALKQADKLPVLALYEGMRELIYTHFLGLGGRISAEETMEKLLSAFYDAWNAATTLRQAGDALKALLGDHLHSINQERSEMEMRPIRLAKKFMQENFQKPLTLEDVSGVAGFHPTYFSTVFKKVTGENFLEYLSELRIKQAKELLSDIHISIPDVAEQVGYADSKYFIKLFKKSTGLTPQEYRKLYY